MTTAAATLRVGFLGTGTVNFGGSEGPWDHASRLEVMANIAIVAIADIDTAKASKVLASRKAGPHAAVYADCQVYPNLEAMLEQAKPEAVIIGLFPFVRGGLEDGRALELTCVRAGIHAFVEKPLSTLPMEQFQPYVEALESARKQQQVIVSVGYKFRYHAAVRKIKEIIRDHGGGVRALSGCYYVAYSELDRAIWWDARYSGGPIIEQATHFCDLSRFLGGDIQEGSIQAVAQKATDPGAELKDIPAGCEVDVPVDARIPRATMATWRFESGGIGSLSHVVAIRGRAYEAYMDVLLDGVRIRLLDPYGRNTRLEVRGLGENPEEVSVLHFGECDQYAEELQAFVEAVRTGDSSRIASDYVDAAKSYKFSWDIVNACNK